MRHTAPSMTPAQVRTLKGRRSKDDPKPDLAAKVGRAKRKHWFYGATEEFQRNYIANNPDSVFAKKLRKHQESLGVTTQPQLPTTEQVIESKADNRVPREWEVDPMSATFAEDYRKTNPGLHMLYTKTAVKHLNYLDVTLTGLYDMSNLMVLDVATAIEEERKKLCQTNAAYAEADQILKSLGLKVGTHIVQPDGE